VAILRDDRWVADALGRALSGAQVYWCTQPASTATNPPSPLAIIYTDTTGATPETQPVVTDGFGHAWAYLDDSVLYTVVIWHPLFGPNPIVLPDQAIGGGGGGGSTHTPFSGFPIGTNNGVNTVFTLSNGPQPSPPPLGVPPVSVVVWNNFPLIAGLGYSIAPGTWTVVFASAPGVTDNIFAQGFYA
jgi:hypothetical protein